MGRGLAEKGQDSDSCMAAHHRDLYVIHTDALRLRIECARPHLQEDKVASRVIYMQRMLLHCPSLSTSFTLMSLGSA